VIATSFDYTRASSLDEAIARLKEANGSGKLIAGGHSLVPLMKLRLSEPGVLIDIARIPGLAGIKPVGDKIEIGAATVHHDVATSALLLDACPMLAEAAASIGDQQVRNRGTLGGSLAHADPAADYPAVMLALDADVHIKGASGTRVAKARTFFRGLFNVNLGPEEIITAVQFTPLKSAAYAKLHQRASHFAIVGVAAALEVRRHDPRGAHRRDRRDAVCTAPVGGRNTVDGSEGHRGDHRRGVEERRRRPRRRQQRPARERRVSPGDGRGVHAARADVGARPRALEAVSKPVSGAGPARESPHSVLAQDPLSREWAPRRVGMPLSRAPAIRFCNRTRCVARFATRLAGGR